MIPRYCIRFNSSGHQLGGELQVSEASRRRWGDVEGQPLLQALSDAWESPYTLHKPGRSPPYGCRPEYGTLILSPVSVLQRRNILFSWPAFLRRRIARTTQTGGEFFAPIRAIRGSRAFGLRPKAAVRCDVRRRPGRIWGGRSRCVSSCRGAWPGRRDPACP